MQAQPYWTGAVFEWDSTHWIVYMGLYEQGGVDGAINHGITSAYIWSVARGVLSP